MLLLMPGKPEFCFFCKLENLVLYVKGQQHRDKCFFFWFHTKAQISKIHESCKLITFIFFGILLFWTSESEVPGWPYFSALTT